ncbi:unnamed protein product [Pedinophyceae sp. YPF-701]|nr:unnamed protein product [Pedinophyceae sp. YPF-701]
MAEGSGFYARLVDEQGSYIETVESGGKVYAIGRPGQAFTLECGLLDGTKGGPWQVGASVAGKDANVHSTLSNTSRTWTCKGFLSNATAPDAAGNRQFTYESFEFAAAVDGQDANAGHDGQAGPTDRGGLVEVRFSKAETWACPLRKGKHCPSCSRTAEYSKAGLAARKGSGGPEKKFFQKPSLGVKGGVSKQVPNAMVTTHSRSVGEPVVLRIQCETRSCLELRGILERPPAPPRATARNNGRGAGEDMKPVIYILD